ncbi:MAG: hypothetical protein KBT11_02610 [Treponema sp.]|nr:hypothetical protein [Candidatus Treponema equifaecale]
MKFKFLAFLIISLLFFSCSDSSDVTVASSDNKLEEKEEDKKKDEENNDDSKTESSKVQVTFSNISSFDVKVYAYQNPITKSRADILVEAGKSGQLNLDKSVSSTGDSFYFEYLVPVGDISFPYFSYENSKIHRICDESENKIIIDELKSCPTKSAYILLENKSNTDFYLLNGSSILSPEGAVSPVIPSEKSGVYILGENSGAVYYKANLLKVQQGTETIPLPEVDFELGNIYTFSVSNSLISLKSVTPFDLDTSKKIWFKNLNVFASNVPLKPVAKESSDLKKGTIVLGTLNTNQKAIGIARIDTYGNYAPDIPNAIFDSNSNLVKSGVLDFAEAQDGSIILLVQNEYSDGNYRQILVRYDFENKNLLWIHPFEETLAFSTESRNKLLLVDEEVLFCGSQISETGMHPFFGKFNQTEKSLSFWKSSNASDFFTSGAESMFTSIYFDGTDFYVCGFENCDYQYSSRVHSGIVYKFDSSLSAQKIYSKDNVIFYSIDGTGKNWFACGEIADSGTILKGIVASNLYSEPIIYTVKNPYCWFKQLFVHNSKIVLCGKSSKDFYGENSASLFTVSFNFNGKQLWFNEDFSSSTENFTTYTDILGITPNSIGTYTLEVFDSTKSRIGIKAADLLGR